MKKILIIIVLGLFLNSCSSSRYTYRETDIQNRSIIANDVVVDVKVDLNKKIQATSTKRNSVELAKSEAYYNAITQNNIDIVVDPIFEINTSDKFLFFGGKSTVKLSGFGGSYINARNKIEAIKELKSVDTLDIHKFNNIYLGIPFPVRKATVLKMGSYSNVKQSVSSNNSLITANNLDNNEKSNVLKSNYGFKVTSAKNTISSDGFGDYEFSGFGLAFTYDSNPNEKFGMKYEIMYSSLDGSGQFSLPVMAKYSLTKRLNVFAGPSLTYLLDPINDSSLSFGIDYGLGLDLGKSVFIDLKFSKGLTSLNDNNDVKLNTFNFGLGFRL